MISISVDELAYDCSFFLRKNTNSRYFTIHNLHNISIEFMYNGTYIDNVFCIYKIHIFDIHDCTKNHWNDIKTISDQKDFLHQELIKKVDFYLEYRFLE